MRVLKFGGTSVGIAANAEQALRLVRERARQDLVVVVSALSGVTNQLVELTRAGAPREGLAEEIARRHLEHARALGVAESVLTRHLAALREEAARSPRDVALSPADADRVLAHGELLAAELFAAALTARGTPAMAVIAGE